MRKLLCFLLFFATLHAEEIPFIASLKNDPSVLIEGSVNAITGQPVAFAEDLVIQGKMPISIHRVYLASQKEGSWIICPTFANASSEEDENGYWTVMEPSGCPIVYRKEKKIKEGGIYYLLCKPTNLGRGWCNTAQGKISSRTDPHNNELLVELPHYRHLIVRSADGSVHTFKKSSSIQKFDQNDPELSGGSYRLLTERHPNGCWTLYDYCHKDGRYLLSSIRTTDPSQKMVFATAVFSYEDPKQKNKRFLIEGSDGQRVEYCFEIDPKTGRRNGQFERISFSHAPSQTYNTLRHTQKYSIKDKVKKKSWPIKQQYERLGSISLPLERSRSFHYYLQDAETVFGQNIKMEDALFAPKWQFGNMICPPAVIPDPRRGRVKAIANGLFSTHAFLYSRGKTSVLETAGRTDYFWGEDLRIHRIERFSPEGILLASEHFEWKEGRLSAKTSLDETNTLLRSFRYFYNDRGDVVEERFYPDNGPEFTWVRTDYAAGLPLKEEHSSGQTIHYQYQPNTDLLICKSLYDKDTLIQRHTFEYDAATVLVRTREEDGVNGVRITSIIPLASGPYVGLPQTIEEGYEEDGLYHRLRKTTLSYTTKGNISQKDIYDANDVFCYSLRTLYDERGRAIQTTDALGQVQTISYDDCDNPIHIKQNGVVTNHIYDRANRLCSTTRAEWTTTHNYDERNRLISQTDPWGAETKYTWNGLNQCIETNLPSGARLKTGYDSLGGETLRIDAKGNQTIIHCNGYNKPTRIAHPDEAVERFFYTPEGWLHCYVDATGIETRYTHDSLGRVLVKETDSAQERFVYTGLRLTAHIDPEGNIHQSRYDGAGRLVEEEFNGLITRYSYDPLGRVAQKQEEDLLTLWEYDFLDRIVEERKESTTGELLRKIRYAYDEAGNRTQVIRFINGQEASEMRTYDAHNRLLSFTNPLGTTETTHYDDTAPRKMVHTDAMGLQTIQTFDLQGRPILIEQQKETILACEELFYDDNDNLIRQNSTVFTPNSSDRIVSTQRCYDRRNRLSELCEADTKYTFYAYTPRSELATKTKPDGTVLSYQYNAFGHLERIVSSDGTVDHQMRTNKLGHLLETDGITRTVDAEGRVLSEAFATGHRVQNSFDLRGRRIACQIPTRTFHYAYNALDLQTVTVYANEQALYQHSYGQRDWAGNHLEETLLDGTKICYTIDLLSRRNVLASSSFNQQVLQYDSVGNILAMRWQNEPQSYAYDDLYNLISESVPIAHSYTFDSLRNRLQKDEECYGVNDLNQVVSHMEYDPNGNPTRLGDTEFSYDALDRVISIVKPGLVQTFTYDSQNRRLSETTNGNTRYFLYDGQNEIGSLNEDLTPFELRILGETPHAEIGAAIACELQGSLYAPIHDLQGNLAALLPVGVNDPPTFYRYSAFGEEIILGKTLSPWRYSSKRTENDLVYFGRRFYSPKLGRWLTPDPAGFTDGLNLYVYVNNDPLTHFDEYGLLDIGQLERQREKQDVKNYLDGKYVFENHNLHYIPLNYSQAKNDRPFGEIVLFTGIRTQFEGKNEFRDMAKYISRLAGNVPVHGIHMPTHGLNFDLQKCKTTLKTMTNSTVLHGRRYFQDASERVGTDGKILALVHSAGAMNAYFAAQDLPQAIRDKIYFHAFAPAKIIPEHSFGFSRNYMSTNQDLLMQFHRISHNKEYQQALNSGQLQKIPAHPNASLFNDHGLMSPTFHAPLRKIVKDFSSQHYCR